MTLQVGDTVRRSGRVTSVFEYDGLSWVSVMMQDTQGTIVVRPDELERVEPGDGCSHSDDSEQFAQQIAGIVSPSAPLTVHLDAAIASLRQALAAAAPGGSMDRLVALVGLVGHAERCVRELPE